MMIRESLEYALPEPDFAQRGGEFTVVLWRDWLTDEVLAGYNLNPRQMQAVNYLKNNERITNSMYQSEFTASNRTASRDLDDLVTKGLVDKVGTTGKGVYYQLNKGEIEGSNTP